jgi:hypothetical protein
MPIIEIVKSMINIEGDNAATGQLRPEQIASPYKLRTRTIASRTQLRTQSNCVPEHIASPYTIAYPVKLRTQSNCVPTQNAYLYTLRTCTHCVPRTKGGRVNARYHGVHHRRT